MHYSIFLLNILGMQHIEQPHFLKQLYNTITRRYHTIWFLPFVTFVTCVLSDPGVPFSHIVSLIIKLFVLPSLKDCCKNPVILSNMNESFMSLVKLCLHLFIKYLLKTCYVSKTSLVLIAVGSFIPFWSLRNFYPKW